MAPSVIKFETLQEEHKQGVLKLLFEQFLVESPLDRSVALDPELSRKTILKMVNQSVQEGVSFVAICEETNQIAGVSVNYLVSRQDKKEFDPEELKINNDAKLLHHVLRDFWEIIPEESDKGLAIGYLSVHNQFFRRGIAQKFIELSILKGRELGCDFLKAEAVSVPSQILFRRSGFESLKTVYYKDFKDECGNVIFHDVVDSPCVELVFKEI